MLASVQSRVFVASVWYGAEFQFTNPRHRLKAKARELIAGDRIEIMIDSNDNRYVDKILKSDPNKTLSCC